MVGAFALLFCVLFALLVVPLLFAALSAEASFLCKKLACKTKNKTINNHSLHHVKDHIEKLLGVQITMHTGLDITLLFLPRGVAGRCPGRRHSIDRPRSPAGR